jgi:hypothetical protein
MTRRKFIHKLIKAGSAIAAGSLWLVRKATPCRSVWAVRLKKYPGTLKPLTDISKQSKWSG